MDAIAGYGCAPVPAENDLRATCSSVCDLPANGEVREPVHEADDSGVLLLYKNRKRGVPRQGLQVRPWSARKVSDHEGCWMVLDAAHLIRGEYDALYCRIGEGFREDVLQALGKLSERRIIALEATPLFNAYPAFSCISRAYPWIKMRRTRSAGIVWAVAASARLCAARLVAAISTSWHESMTVSEAKSSKSEKRVGGVRQA